MLTNICVINGHEIHFTNCQSLISSCYGKLDKGITLIEQIQTLCVTTVRFWPAQGFLWEDNILYRLHVFFSCGQLASC